MDCITETAQAILSKHEEKLTKRSAEGNIRSLELKWAQWNMQFHKMRMAPFTDKERGNIKFLLEGLGSREVEFLLREATEHWDFLLSQPSLNVLPPTPTFGALFAFRETIRSHLHSRLKVKQKKESALEKIDRFEQETKRQKTDIIKSGMSLVEMAKQARKEIQDGRQSRTSDQNKS